MSTSRTKWWVSADDFDCESTTNKPLAPPYLRRMALDIALDGFFFDGVPFVVKLLALAQPQEHFGTPLLEVELERDHCQPLFAALGGELLDFAPMNEQFARPLRYVIELVAPLVFRNIAAQEPQLAAAEPGVGLFQRYLAGSQAFDFAADQDNPALERVEHQVLVMRAAVLRDEPLVVVLAIDRAFGSLFTLGGFFGRGSVPFAGYSVVVRI